MRFIYHIRRMKNSPVIILLILLIGCNQGKNALPVGFWRAELVRQDGNIIPFNVESKDSAGKIIWYVQNAGERLLVDSIRLIDDSIFIEMPFFDSRIRAKLVNNDQLEGAWIKRLEAKEQSLPFRAKHNEPDRFVITGKKGGSAISGRWEVDFVNIKNGDSTRAVGEFVQTGNQVTGTFLNPSGDYRYLQGVVDGDSLKLSCFDGGHAFLFTAVIKDDQTLTDGYFYSGPTYFEKWTARKNAQARIADEYEGTKLKKGESRLDFKFKSIDGDSVSINDERFKNKVVLVQLMGSWCPNCMDETSFLSEYYNLHRKDGVEIVALAYERSTDFTRSQQTIRVFQKRFNVQYPMLVTGVTVADTLRSEKTLPQLEKINAFPTLLFIDKKGKVSRIHTGFTGPGTGEYFEHFKNDFYKIMGDLLRQE